jgi:hypothetical protein
MSKLGVGTFVEENYEKSGDQALDLFSTPPKEDAMLHGKEILIFPQGAITDTGPYDFLIASDGNDYTAMSLTRLHGTIQVTKPDGSTITDTELNSTVNLLPQSLFRQVECYVNGFQVVDLSTPTYGYKAFIQTHLGNTDDAKKITFFPEMYAKDTVKKENTFVITGDTKADSFVASHTLHKSGKIDFSMQLHIDFLQSQRLLIPGVELKLRFVRNDDAFSLLGATLSTKIKIHKLSLSVHRITLDPSVADTIEKSLQAGHPAIYPIANSKIKTYILSSGHQSERISQIFRGPLPRQIIIGFVDSKGVDGVITQNPFKFEPFQNNLMNVFINGEPLVPHTFQPDGANGKYMREYRWFLDNTACRYSAPTHGITYEEFCNNSFFYVFDLSPDLCNSTHLHTALSGTFDMHVGFASALTKNVTAIIYATFNEFVTIDKNGIVNIVTANNERIN